MPPSLVSFMTCTGLSFMLPSWRTRVSQVLVSIQVSPASNDGSKLLLSQVAFGYLHGNTEAALQFLTNPSWREDGYHFEEAEEKIVAS